MAIEQDFPTAETPGLKPYQAAVRAARETQPLIEEFAPDAVVADILTVERYVVAALAISVESRISTGRQPTERRISSASRTSAASSTFLLLANTRRVDHKPHVRRAPTMIPPDSSTSSRSSVHRMKTVVGGAGAGPLVPNGRAGPDPSSPRLVQDASAMSLNASVSDSIRFRSAAGGSTARRQY